MTSPNEHPLVVSITGRVERDDVPRLCGWLRAMIAAAARQQVVCSVAEVDRPGLAAIDALARLQLAARRTGTRLVFRDVPADLAGLVELCGLSDVLAIHAEPRESGRQAEERKEPLGVEEERDPDDPAV